MRLGSGRVSVTTDGESARRGEDSRVRVVLCVRLVAAGRRHTRVRVVLLPRVISPSPSSLVATSSAF